MPAAMASAGTIAELAFASTTRSAPHGRVRYLTRRAARRVRLAIATCHFSLTLNLSLREVGPPEPSRPALVPLMEMTTVELVSSAN